MDQRQLLLHLKDSQKALQRQGIQSLSLFGSFATQKASPHSDVDLLVSFNRPLGLFGLMAVKDYLETTLNLPVDLVTPESLHPHLKPQILKEAIHVF